MSRFTATSVCLTADTDYGEGRVVFQWPHEFYGYEELTIDLDGYCSRRMPIHSGDGPPEFVELRRDSIKLRFTRSLAEKLHLAEEIEISFQLSDDEFSELQRVVEYFNGEDE